MPRIGAQALVVLVIFALPGWAAAAWECRSENFLVISEPGAEIAQAAAEHLEALRESLLSLGLAPPHRSEPMVVLVFADRTSLDAYSPADSRDPAWTSGLSLAGPDRVWIAVAWNAQQDKPVNLAHEYAHLVRQDPDDPLWFREGFAEYLARLPLDALDPAQVAAARYHPLLLRQQTWIDWPELLAANRMSAAFARPSFYSQAWLAVHWLAARSQGIQHAQPPEMLSLLLAHGSEWLGAQLREHLERLTPQPPPQPKDGAPDSTKDVAFSAPSQSQPQQSRAREGANRLAATTGCKARMALDWELPFWKAEFHREVGHREQARLALEALESDYPDVPEPSAALGAAAIYRGDYDLAERKLHAAILKGSRSPQAHHRYSLMLMRPLEASAVTIVPDAVAGDRVGRAIWHARQARLADPDEPAYVLSEAQALALAAQWDAAARLLLQLQRFPGWERRSSVEFAELLRRRQQLVRRLPAPDTLRTGRLARATHATLPAFMAAWLDPTPPGVPKPPPPPKPKLIWPPPGTVLLYGHINGVECRETEKIVTVRTPRFTVELRERAASPAKLYHAPALWDGLPCGLRGYEVNVVYRPLPEGGEVRGELVAVVF